ncbi:MAG: NUDIX hydrolase [Candidatus Woesearchaeota archaeon]|jgi:ADP-ribose pyrophosphatase|nr:NUDIX hydrolase [Candidatus Woesearchaeota archaeon]
MSKIPEHAKCVFKGVLFEIYQWKQEMFDGTFKTFEAVKRPGTVRIIAITRQGKIIMQREEQPHIGKFTNIPAGRMDQGEEPIDSAKRELLEESGYVSEDILEFYKFPSRGKVIGNSYMFIARECYKKQDQNFEFDGERIETFFVDFGTFIKETQKEEFRDNQLTDLIFRMIHTPGELDKFKELLFSKEGIKITN